ncbi:actin-depolymerizing factor isoform X2 [Gossypium hirsutum]|uniref:Actin-depolymerizing factor isoform X2 n=1 Tax=Gossypium hirsutum TaxID=3635 RepID=A0ABM2YRS9_GOSHI|nr:actin-depolymerizing factor-like isoform X2 [Gossypium hirsutum]
MSFRGTNASSGMGVADHSKSTYLELQRKKVFRYVVFKINEKKKEDCKIINPYNLWMMWSPSVSRIRAKMLYATSKERFISELEGIHYEIQATDPTGMDLEVIRERAS